MPVNHNHRIVFMHIAKTGGSSIEKMLSVFPKDFHEFNPEIMIGIDPSNDLVLQTLPLSYYQHYQPSLSMDYFKFTVVRNPYDRCVSDYMENNRGMTFRTYLERIKTLLASRSTEDLLKYNDFYTNHVIPQTTLMEKTDFDLIIRFESLNNGISRLNDLLGTDFVLPHIGQSKRRPNYKIYYDQHTRKLVEEIYAADLSALNYSFD